MHCEAENYKNYDNPVLAGNFRFLLGLILTFAGFYISTLSDIQGHALGLLLVFGAPFVIFKDDK
ncbi:MAG: hypothetical protein WA584_21710 [Pyrinomonadaceae bacterium]